MSFSKNEIIDRITENFEKELININPQGIFSAYQNTATAISLFFDKDETRRDWLNVFHQTVMYIDSINDKDVIMKNFKEDLLKESVNIPDHFSSLLPTRV